MTDSELNFSAFDPSRVMTLLALNILLHIFYCTHGDSLCGIIIFITKNTLLYKLCLFGNMNGEYCVGLASKTALDPKWCTFTIVSHSHYLHASCHSQCGKKNETIYGNELYWTVVKLYLYDLLNTQRYTQTYKNRHIVISFES